MTWNNGVLAGCNPVAPGQVGSIPTSSTNLCESGGMVYTTDLKSVAERLAGSSPASRTKNCTIVHGLVRKVNGGWAAIES